jgi:hypothetical protein
MPASPELIFPAAEPMHCPLCTYDLRATTEPRCPECGYAFDLDEIRNPARRLHPYAFEHHPERNVSSFVQTLLAGLRPKRFWRTMYPTQPSRPRRLVLYWLVCTTLCMMVLAAHVTRTIVRLDTDQATQARLMATRAPQTYPPEFIAKVIAEHGSVQAWADASMHRWPHPQFLRWIHRSPPVAAIAVPTLLWILWPWLTLVGLMIFQISMQRAQVRPIHVLRVVLYGGDLVLWWAIALTGLLAVDVYRNGIFGVPWAFGSTWPVRATPALAIVLLVVATSRIAAAYRHYLRFPHALATALAVQVMIALLAWKLALDWDYLL